MELTKKFYVDFLGMELVMDMDWVLTFASKVNPTVQINVLKNETKGELSNSAIFLSIEVSDVDKMHQKAQQSNCEITYSIRNESWGVRRFFVKDPNGATINLLSHQVN